MTWTAGIPLGTDNISTSQSQLLGNINFLSSTAGNNAEGYYILPNGLILQWGNYSAPGGHVTSGSVSVSFPTEFSSSVYSIQITLQASSSYTPGQYFVDKTSAPNMTRFYLDWANFSSSSSSYIFYWFAIGV